MNYTYINPEGYEQVFAVSLLADKAIIAAYLSNNIKNVYIPDYIEDKPVTAVNYGCFFGLDEIEHITFPKFLQEIGESAFGLCSNLQELVIPDSVSVIRQYAFRDCKSLRKVIMPKNLETIERSLFSFAAFPENAQIVLPENLKTIREHAFYSTWLPSLVIPDSVTAIERGAFMYGPQPVTKLPYDKAWFRDFPYGETVRDKNGRTGIVSETISLDSLCCTAEISFGSDTVKAFYPFVTDEFSFTDDENNQRNQRILEHIPKVRDIYEKWLLCGGNL
ncbi:MAG: leucine-rich repeat domain-containing protein [Ruminococcus sp.]|nr:leucine-rich repeat domain-containing protein [Ruminococcus sp.]